MIYHGMRSGSRTQVLTNVYFGQMSKCNPACCAQRKTMKFNVTYEYALDLLARVNKLYIQNVNKPIKLMSYCTDLTHIVINISRITLQRTTTLHLKFGACKTVPGVSSLGSWGGKTSVVGGNNRWPWSRHVTKRNILSNVVLIPIHALFPTPKGMKFLKTQHWMWKTNVNISFVILFGGIPNFS